MLKFEWVTCYLINASCLQTFNFMFSTWREVEIHLLCKWIWIENFFQSFDDVLCMWESCWNDSWQHLESIYPQIQPTLLAEYARNFNWYLLSIYLSNLSWIPFYQFKFKHMTLDIFITRFWDSLSKIKQSLK